MNTHAAASQDHDLLLGQVATEFFERLSRGEAPQVDEYIQRHPEIAELIRHALPALQMVSDSIADASSIATSLGERHEKRLGDFHILHELGRGGMGIVYEAEQISMGRRKVALKVLPFAAMVDEKRLQRFRNEIRAAASLDHPNIVSVYSVGEERGVHFYAMQLIRGQNLAALIDQLRELRQQQNPLSGSSLKEVLSASVSVPSASGGTEPTEDHFAPNSSDSKHDAHVGPRAPSLETVPEAQGLIRTKGSPRRSEFFHSVAELGIQAAEALEHAHQQGVIHRDIKPANLMVDANAKLYITDFGLAQMEDDVGITMTGDIVGTLRYMSPEQALGKRVTIDHRADIYALGVSLYELLTTEPAFDGENRATLLKQIAFQELRRLQQIDRTIPHDLETIIHKAVAKNPDERYFSAQELANDLKAFRNNQPISARPPSIIDRSRKWTFRNQGFVLAIAIIMLLTTVGLAISNSIIAAQRTAARTEAAVAAAVIEFINTDLLGSATPNAEPNRELKVREVLDRAARNIERQFKDQPLVAAAIGRTLGKAFTDLGEYKQAESHLNFAQQLYLQHRGSDHVDSLLVDMDLAKLYSLSGQIQRSAELYQLLLERASRTRGAEDPITLNVRSILADRIRREGNYREAEKLTREVLDIQRRVLGPEHPDSLFTMTMLSVAIILQGRSDEAEQLSRESCDLHRRLFGPENPKTLRCICNHAQYIKTQGRFGESETLHREVLETQRRVLGPEHPDTLFNMSQLAVVIGVQGRYAEAEQLNREIVEVERRVLGPEHPETLSALNGISMAIFQQGRAAEAEQLFLEVLEICRRVFRPGHPHTLTTLDNLAFAIFSQGRFADAHELYREGLDIRRRVFGLDDPFTREGESQVAKSASGFSWRLATDADPALRDPQRAVEFASEATQLQPDQAGHWLNLGVALYRADQWQEAVECFNKADAMKAGGDRVHRMFLAMSHWQLGEQDLARQRYTEGAAWIEANRKDNAEQQRFRAEAEELLGISEQERNELIGQYGSSQK